VEPVKENLRRYKSNWPRHVPRMNSNRMTKMMLNCRRNRRSQLGRPLKRLSDEAERGLSGPNLLIMMMMMMMQVILETKNILPTYDNFGEKTNFDWLIGPFYLERLATLVVNGMRPQ